MLELPAICDHRGVVFLPRTKEGPGRRPIEHAVCVWKARPVPHYAKVRSRVGEDDSIIARCNDWLVAVRGGRIAAVEMALNGKRVQEDTSAVRVSRKPSPVEYVIPNLRFNLTGKVLPSLPPWPMARGIIPEILVSAAEWRNDIRIVASGIGGVHEVLPALLDVGQSSCVLPFKRETCRAHVYIH